MTEQQKTADATLQGDLKEIAFRTLREWLCCNDFRGRSPIEEALDTTWLGRAIQDLKERKGWQWYKSEEGRYLQQLKKEVIDTWLENGWVQLSCPRLGRRRVAEYSSNTIRKAMAIWNNGCQGYVSDSSWSWAGSVLGENSNKNKLFIITLTDEVFGEVYRQIDHKDLDGSTREELAVILDLPKRVANHFMRYLVQSDEWKVVLRSTSSGRKRVLIRQHTPQAMAASNRGIKP